MDSYFQYSCITSILTCKAYVVPLLTLGTFWLMYISYKLKEIVGKLSHIKIFNGKNEKPNYVKYYEQSQKTGNEMFWLNRQKTKLVLNSGEVVRAAFTKGDDFSGRSPNFSLDMVSSKYREALKIMHERNWKLLRRIAHKALLKQAIRNDDIDKIIQNETKHLIKNLNLKSGKQIDATIDLMLTVVNISAVLVFGERFEKNDERFECIKNILSKTFSKSNAKENRFESIKNFIEGIFMKKENLSAERMLETFIQFYLNKNSTSTSSNVIEEVLNVVEEDQCRFNIKGEQTKYFVAFAVVFEIFFSSLEPVLATLQWTLLYLSRCQEYQDTINCQTVQQDKNDILNAVLHETQRVSVVVPLYPRACSQESLLHGHKINKGTTLMINTYALHYDESVWGNPEKFQPERWLNEDGVFQKLNSHNFIPFGGGQRRCIGEQLAGKEMKIILKEILSNFCVKGCSMNKFGFVEGTFNVPQTFQLIFERR